MRRLLPQPLVERVSPRGALGIPSFADWMRTCLFDPRCGYYASGRVQFGADGDFATYPSRLSPAFGWMLLDAMEHLLAPMLVAIGRSQPLTLLEFGAGDGTLARDLLERVAMLRARPPWDELAPRIRYRSVEPSSAMRERQRTALRPWLADGVAEIVDGSIADYRSPEPFCGFVFANEVLDTLPCEQIHVARDGLFRTHVVARRADESVVAADELSDWMCDDGAGTVSERHVSLADGWVDGGDEVDRLPEALSRHLATLGPLIEDLRSAALVPSDYYWSPDVSRAMETITDLLRHGSGAAMIVDYGGTARHVLDRSLLPHLRVYSGQARTMDPYRHPGAVDITWDVDFTELGELGRRAGLEVHFGHQRILDADEPLDADEELLRSFRHAKGFRTMTFAPPGYPIDEERFGRSDDWSGSGLATIAATATRESIAAALTELGLERIAPIFGRCCDIVGSLSDMGHYARRWEVLEALARHALLEWPESHVHHPATSG